MTAGVYTIRNTITGSMYVGVSSAIEARWHQHRSTLRHGKHRSARLQADWNEYGADGFAFVVFQHLPANTRDDDLRMAERDAITKLLANGVDLYNGVGMDPVKLKAERQKAALSLRDLGRMSGVSYVTLQRIEAGLAQAHLSTVRKVATALGIKPEVLMSETPDQSD